MAHIDKKITEWQSECPHLETTYHADAAGGSDSHTDCNWCGAEVPRQIRKARSEA